MPVTMQRIISKYYDSLCKLWENYKGRESAPVDDKNTANCITLYFNYYSYYSQKVLMALHEKRLSFVPAAVDITRGDQYTSWFLRLNPRGEVPVLRDNGRLMRDSARILDHLEKAYCDSNPLVKVSEDDKVVQKMEELRDLLEAVPVGVITMGSFFHQDLCDRPKLPFTLTVRNTLKNSESKNASNLRRLAAENPDASATLLHKAEIHERKHELLANRDQYLKVLNQLDQVLEALEKQLASQPAGNWLCCESFTLADISLTVLLERLNVLGLENRFWAKNKRPHLEDYYSRVRQRASYKAAVPGLLFHLKIMLWSQPPIALTLICAGSLSAVVTTMYIVKKSVF